MPLGYLAAAQRIEIELGPIEGACLDVGCNTGSGMLALAKRWPKTLWYGLEPSAKFVIAAQAKGLNVDCGEAEATPYGDGTFDFVFSRHSLEHMRHRESAIYECWRVLRQGGCLYVQAPIEPEGTKNKLHVSPFLSLEELRGSFPMFTEVYWGPQPTVGEFMGRKT